MHPLDWRPAGVPGGTGVNRREAIFGQIRPLAGVAAASALHLNGGAAFAQSALPNRRSDPQLTVLVEQDSEATQALIGLFSDRAPSVRMMTLQQALTQSVVGGIVFSIGPKVLAACKEALSVSSVISLFTSWADYHAPATANAQPDAKPSRYRRGTSVTGIWSDPKPEAQMRLIADLMRPGHAVAMPHSAALSPLLPILKQAANSNRVELLPILVDKNSNAVRAIARITRATSFLIAPDPVALPVSGIRDFLEATYRRGAATFGYSQGLVRAGALCSVVSSASDVVSHALDLLEELSEDSIPSPTFCKHWQVAANPSVARSLGISIPERVMQLSSRSPAGGKG